jgi:hypothetical protein
MQSRLEEFGKHILAFVILLLAAWILLQFVIHIAAAIFTVVLVVLAIVAFIWALRILL